jgi:methylation protein EvaC
MGNCLACGSTVETVLDFGKMPIANGFLHEEDFPDEFFHHLQICFCPDCSMVQIAETVDPVMQYHENYAYFASTSSRMRTHFNAAAIQIRSLLKHRADPFIVEIGSNDGIMLQRFAKDGVRHLGVEPSQNVANEAVRNGVSTQCSFFDESTATEILRKHGPADAIYGANVVTHIPDIHSVMAAVEILLEDDGYFILEDPYLGDVLEKTAYDQFYDEHVFYFCLSSLQNLLGKHGMTIVDVEPQQVHGGSMRYFAMKKAKPSTYRLETLQRREKDLGLSQAATFRGLNDRISASKDQLVTILSNLNRERKRVVGYGATAKSSIVTNFCGIGPDLIEFISDTTPIKQNKFSPGTHIPVKPYDAFVEDYPDYAVLFAWNHGGEILAKEEPFLKQGGRFITFVPDVRILEYPGSAND